LKIRLWIIEQRETEKAHCYSRIPPERNPQEEDIIWVPKSIVEHRTKRGLEHEVELPDWFAEARNL
jgi:hypothetical protein